jgi:hypothetical protein
MATSSKGSNNAPSDKALTRVAGPWMPLQDPLKGTIPIAKDIYNQGNYQFGPTVNQPLSPWEQEGQGRNVDISRASSGGLQRGFDFTSSFGSGDRMGAQTAGSGFTDYIASGGGMDPTAGQNYRAGVASGAGVGGGPGEALMQRFGSGSEIGNVPGQGYLNKLGSGALVGNVPGQGYLNKVGTGALVGKAPGMDLLKRYGSGSQIGETPGLDTAEKYASSLGKSPGAPTMQAANRLATAGGENDLGYLKDVIGGKYLDKGNPYLNDVINSSLEQANRKLTSGLEGRMSMAGRLGSNAEAIGQGEVAKQLGDISSSIRYQNYNTERDRQQQAGLALPGARATEVGSMMGAGQGLSQDLYSRIQQQLGAAQQATTGYQADVGQSLGAAGKAADVYQRGVDQATGAAVDRAGIYQRSQDQAANAAVNQAGIYQRSQDQAIGAASAAHAAYGADQDRALAATGADEQNRLAQRGQALTAGGMARDAYQSDANLAFQGAAQQGQSFQNTLAPGQAIQQAGEAQRTNQQAMAQEAQDQARFNQEEPYNRLQRLLQQYQGMSGMTNPQAAGQLTSSVTGGPSGTEVATGNIMSLLGMGAKAKWG